RSSSITAGDGLCPSQRLFEPGAALVKVSSTLPESKQGCRSAQRQHAVLMRQRPTESSANVLVLDFDALQRGNLIRSGRIVGGTLHELQQRLGMPATEGACFARSFESLQRVLADWLQQAIARDFLTCVDEHHRLVHQQREQFQNVWP